MSNRITFSLPMICYLYAGAAAILLTGSFFIFDWLRYAQCPAWVEWPRPPQKTAALLGDLGLKPYIKSTGNTVYCYDGKAWKECSQSVYAFSPAFAPAWLTPRLVLPGNQGIQQLLRVGQWQNVTYVALSAGGLIWACPTTFDAEVVQMARSGMVLWVFLPLLGGLFFAWLFVSLASREASPTLWDWSGRGTKVK